MLWFLVHNQYKPSVELHRLICGKDGPKDRDDDDHQSDLDDDDRDAPRDDHDDCHGRRAEYEHRALLRESLVGRGECDDHQTENVVIIFLIELLVDKPTFAVNFQTAKAMEVTKDTKDSCRAFHVLIPRTPRASGMKVMAFRRRIIKIGERIFFTFDFFLAINCKFII